MNINSINNSCCQRQNITEQLKSSYYIKCPYYNPFYIHVDEYILLYIILIDD